MLAHVSTCWHISHLKNASFEFYNSALSFYFHIFMIP